MENQDPNKTAEQPQKVVTATPVEPAPPGSFSMAYSDDYSGLRTTSGLRFTGAMLIGLSLVVVCLAVAIWSLFQPPRYLNIGRADNEPVSAMKEICPIEPGMLKDLYEQNLATHFYQATRRAVRGTNILTTAWEKRYGVDELMPEIKQGLAIPANIEEFVETNRFSTLDDEYLAGMLELYGIEVAPNQKRGLSRIRFAARKGHTLSIRQFALLSSSLDDNLPENFEKMMKFATHAGKCGDKLSYLIIVKQIEKQFPGRSSPVHKLLLSTWYKKAGIVDEYAPPSPRVAIAKIRKKIVPAANESSSNSVSNAVNTPPSAESFPVVQNTENETAMRAAKSLDLGQEGKVKDPKKAFELYLAEAERNNSRAQVILAEKYLSGSGAKKDEAQARKWFSRAANLGDSVAATRYGSMLLEGVGGPMDLSEAEAWLSFAADNGDLAAMKDLVMVYKLTGKTDLRIQLESQIQNLSTKEKGLLAH